MIRVQDEFTLLDLTAGTSPLQTTMVFATYADLLASTAPKGVLAVVTSDPDTSKNGKYDVLKTDPRLDVDVLKKSDGDEIKDWTATTNYKSGNIVIDTKNNYKAYYSPLKFTSGAFISGDIASGHLLPMSSGLTEWKSGKNFSKNQLLIDPVTKIVYVVPEKLYTSALTIDLDIKSKKILPISGTEGLRGKPVVDSAELIAIEAKDFELRQIKADPKVTGSKDIEYVFKFGASSGDYQDALKTGYWIAIEKNVNERYSEVMGTKGQSSVVTPFELNSPLVFRDGLIAENNTWSMKANKLGIDTPGEARNTTIDIINMASLFDTEKYNTVTTTTGIKDFMVGNNMEEKSIIVFKNGIILQPTEYIFDIAKPSFISFTTGVPRKTTITIVYKRMK